MVHVFIVRFSVCIMCFMYMGQVPEIKLMMMMMMMFYVAASRQNYATTRSWQRERHTVPVYMDTGIRRSNEILHKFCEPPHISAYTLYCQNLESLDYIFVANSVGPTLSSFKFLWWAPKDACVLKQNA